MKTRVTYQSGLHDWLVEGEHSEVAVEHAIGVPTPYVEVSVGVEHAA